MSCRPCLIGLGLAPGHMIAVGFGRPHDASLNARVLVRGGRPLNAGSDTQ